MILDIGQIQQMIRDGQFSCGDEMKQRIMDEKLTEEDVVKLSKLFRGLQYSANTVHLMFSDVNQAEFNRLFVLIMKSLNLKHIGV